MFRAVVIAVVATAVAAPVAVARHAPGDFVSSRQVVSQASVSDELDARLGPKYISLPRAVGHSVQAVARPSSQSAGGFPYRVLIPLSAALLVLGGLVVWRRAPRGSVAGRVPVED